MKYFCLLVVTVMFTLTARAETSSTIVVVSDYLFNGVSQTDERPALQVSLDWAGEDGIYAGLWGSNVKFGEGTNLEADGYLGYSTTLTNTINIDIGVAQYSYHGESFSSDYNYAETWLKVNYGHYAVNFWYAWDYFGTGAGHVIAMVTYTLPISDSFSVLASTDISTSLDEQLWSWESNDKDYIHWRVGGQYQFKGLDFSLGIEGTDLDTYGDTTLLLTVSRTFNF